MNLEVRNYYLKLLACCGEITSLRANVHAPAARSTAGDELRRMMKDGLIRYYRHADDKRSFRICDPAGFEAIGECDPRLLEHAELLVGKRKDRYTGSKAYRLKKRREAELMFTLLDAAFIVDGMKLKAGRSMDLLSPTLSEPKAVIRSSADATPLFLSGAMLRHKGTAAMHKRREMSISSGTLFTRSGIYTTFVISTGRFRWYAAAETAAAIDISRMYEDVKGLDRRKDGRFRAIFYVTTKEAAAEMLKLSCAGSHKMNPLRIFRLCYIVPFDDKSLTADVTKMLAIPEWRRKADKLLGMSPEDRYDGLTEDGRRIHNLLCCNISKILDIETEVKNHKCRIVIHDWQKPVLEEFYGTEIDAVILGKKHFRGLLLAVEGNDDGKTHENEPEIFDLSDLGC